MLATLLRAAFTIGPLRIAVKARGRAECRAWTLNKRSCDAFDEEIGPRLGLAATDPAKPR